ncbi:hypothetical protein ISS39_03000 [Candidatus Bathyarchaeota archaeon]|nr:hypothetical protein [Candidatus Bathyarchaeota archaeon]
MDVLLRGLCELQIDDFPDKSLTQEYSVLLMELGIPEESKRFFLMGYIAGSARSRLNASNLAMFNRPLNGDEIDVFSEVLGRRIDGILEKILNQEIEDYVKEGSVAEEPQPDVDSEYEEPPSEDDIEEVPLKTVATIGNLEIEEEKYRFKISGRKKSSPTILGIPVTP